MCYSFGTCLQNPINYIDCTLRCIRASFRTKDKLKTHSDTPITTTTDSPHTENESMMYLQRMLLCLEPLRHRYFSDSCTGHVFMSIAEVYEHYRSLWALLSTPPALFSQVFLNIKMKHFLVRYNVSVETAQCFGLDPSSPDITHLGLSSSFWVTSRMACHAWPLPPPGGHHGKN